MMTNNSESQTPEAVAEDEAKVEVEAGAEALPPGYDDYAGEIRVANGKPPRWLGYLPYIAVILGLGYFIYVRATNPVDLVFAGLLLAWLIYTPIAKRRGWFHIPL